MQSLYEDTNTNPVPFTISQQSSTYESQPLLLSKVTNSDWVKLTNSKSAPAVFISERVLFGRWKGKQNPTLLKKTDWLGRRIINLFKCQTGFRTLCLFCQTICSNLISITEPDSTWDFFFFPCLSKCLREINWWFSVQMSDKVDSRKQFISRSPHRSLCLSQ